jgi:hypothetical protein
MTYRAKKGSSGKLRLEASGEIECSSPVRLPFLYAASVREAVAYLVGMGVYSRKRDKKSNLLLSLIFSYSELPI